jgi:hypothetical protein
MQRALTIGLIGLLFFSCGKSSKVDMSRKMDESFIRAKLAKYVQVPLEVPRQWLTDRDLTTLRLLVKAAQAIDEIFWMQSAPHALEIRKALEKSDNPIDRDYLHFLMINYGPYDRQGGDKPFIGRGEKPAGAGFYPPDITKEELLQYIEAHPEVKDSFFKMNTVIRREGNKLIAVPYETVYRKWLEQAAGFLRQAAETTEDSLFRKYLKLRADALLSGDFFASDMAWMDLKENLLDIVIGPIETYEDRLLGLKASYEGIVLVRDREATAKISRLARKLNRLEALLPVPRIYRKTAIPPLGPIGVFYTVYVSGEANAGVKSIAFSLPNDEKVRELKGARTVQQKNIILAKFQHILVPIAGRVLTDDLLPFVDGEAFFTNTMLHELAHPLGLNYLKDNPEKTVREALKETYSAIEEAKADVVGLYNVQHLIRMRLLPRDFEKKAYTTFLASIFRSVRFGVTEAHAQANMIIFNYLMHEKGILYDPEAGKFRINWKRFQNGIKKLAADLLMIQGDGDYERAREWLQTLTVIPDPMKAALDRLKDIPVDVEFQFDPILFENP